jgi:muconolactone delta-isomerase
MKRLISLALSAATLAALLTSAPARAQQNTKVSASAPGVSSTTASPAEVERMVRTMAAKETEFSRALSEYGFKREAIIQTVGLGGQITGEYKRLSAFVMDDQGKRFERILSFPLPTITEVSVTAEDLEDLGGVQAFALEASQIGRYNFNYVGKERIDELDLHVFDVAPKVMPDPKKGERLFKGRIWVDDQDFQIVKARGKGVPEGKQRFPTFETYRENIGGRYWFPTYAYADDELVFENGQVVHLRMKIRYTDFEPLRGKVRIIEEGTPGEVIEDETPTPAPAAKPTPTPKPKP